MKKIVCIVLSLFCAFAAMIPPQSAAATTPDEYDMIRSKWKTMLDGGPALNIADPDISAKVLQMNTEANEYWSSMNKSTGRTYLWSDLANGATTSSQVTASYTRLRAMAFAYAMAGSSLYGNASLRTDMINGLDWLYNNWYTKTGTAYGNGWDWSIGAPSRLKDIMVLLYDFLTTTQISNYIDAIENYGSDISSEAAFAATGANRSDILKIYLVCGLLEKNSTRLGYVRDRMSPLFDYVTSGDGFYRDGSSIMHTYVAYTATYGQVLLDGVADILSVLSGTTWDITDSDKANVYNWVYDSFEPIVYKGAAMDMVRGRAIARESEPDRTTGHYIIGSIAKLAEGAPATDAANYKRMIKAWVQQDTVSNIYKDLGLIQTILVKNIMADPLVLPKSELILHKEYANMDRTVHLAEGFGFGLSRSSIRVQNYELTNGENSKGWTTGDGMTYIYNNDLQQFSSNYWCTVNPLRLPGTTVEVRSRYVTDYQVGDGEGRPANTWSGGATLGNFGVSGMNLIPRNGSTTGTLDAYKSWFMFDDEVVAVGSKINASSGYKVESIIENRLISGGNNLLVNGTSKLSAANTQEDMTGVSWMHLEGNVAGSDIGYYFPGGAAVSGIRQVRSGTWYDVNRNETASKETKTNTFMTLFYNHGTNPTDASYNYVLLPNKNSSEVSSYASNPDIAVLSSTTSVHAVKELTLGVTGYNFFTDAVASVQDITVNKKASVMTKEVLGNTYEISIADPTMTNTGTIEVEINKPGTLTISKDSQITVTQLSPTIKFTVSVNNAKGKTFHAKFQLRPGISLAGMNSTALWSDNFNGEATGVAPAGWTITNSTNTAALIDETPSAANKSVKFTDPNTSGQSIMKRSYTTQNNLLVAEWKFMEPAGGKWPYFKILNGATEAITLNSGSGRINFIGSTGINQAATPIRTNTWYTIKVVVDIPSKQYDIYVNNELKVVRASFRNSVTSLNSISFQSGYSGPNATMYIDDVVIKNGSL